MFEDISQLRRIRKKYNLQMFRSGISTFHELEELEANAFKSGALDQKHKELIGLAVGVVNGCYGGIEYHVSSAADLGASREEILEATAVAMAIGGGNTQWPARFVFKVLEELDQAKNGESSNKETIGGTKPCW